MNKPLFTITRAGVPEIHVFGELVVHDGRKIVFQSGERRSRVPARSLLKPFQFQATGLSVEDSTPKRVPCLGSVSATEEQVNQIRNWYPVPEGIMVPPALPMDEGYRSQLKKSGGSPHVLYSNCYSKHVAIVEACQKNGWPTETYLEIGHPYQQKLFAGLGKLLGNKANFETVTDGCLLPSPVLDIAELAHLYQRLAEGIDGLSSIFNAMNSFPEWVGSPERWDTRLMKANPGALVAKEGADGLLGVAVRPSPQYPDGLGIVVKVWSGFQPQWMQLVLQPILKHLGLKTVAEVPPGQEVEFHFGFKEPCVPKVFDVSPVLSPETAVWPGDKKFQRFVSFDTERGHHFTLSDIQTTVHIGAHTDAPNHFITAVQGIDAVDPAKYIGPCQVIEVKVPRGEVILPSHLQGKSIRAQRVIFKTGTFPNPYQFNEDFVSLSAELVRFLAEKGVKLVGIDTPSIDPFSSKDLPAHKTTGQYGVAILEGIELETVAEGDYELVSLPLKIADADASPVRAVLLKI